MNEKTETRKREHIETVLREDVSAKDVTTGFERFFFEHIAVPELDLNDVDLSTHILGHRLEAPIFISSMTGGTEAARHINQCLAEVFDTPSRRRRPGWVVPNTSRTCRRRQG